MRISADKVKRIITDRTMDCQTDWAWTPVNWIR